MRLSALVFGLAGFVLGLGAAIAWPLVASQPAAGPKAPAAAFAPPALKAEVPAYRGLDANLYMQISAEYRACCYQTYAFAQARLRERFAETRSQPGKKAIVLDLDETVFDNAGYQAMMLRSNLAFDLRLWDLWEERHADGVGLIPGAREFLLEADRLGVTPFYISNRSAKFAAQARSILLRFGLPLKEESQLKFATTTSDKTARRKEVTDQYQVLLYLGDNLRDFDDRFRSKIDLGRTGRPLPPEELKEAVAARYAEVESTRGKFGTEWIILPNPAYGEWNKVLGQGERDLDLLVPAKSNK